MKNVNLNALRVFAVVASHGNLQRAADELNLSRGAVSQRIKQLDLQARKLVEIWVDPEPSDDGLYISWPKDHLGQTRMKRIVDWFISEFE